MNKKLKNEVANNLISKYHKELKNDEYNEFLRFFAKII